MNIGFDSANFSSRGIYLTGSATDLEDPSWQARAQDYRRRLSGYMRPLSGDEIPRIPETKNLYASRKYDGEFGLIAFDGDTAVSVNPGGTVRAKLPCLLETADLLKKAGVPSCVLAGEFYRKSRDGERTRVHHVIRLLRSPESAGDLEQIGLAVFDIVQLNDAQIESIADVYRLLEAWFADGVYVHRPDYRRVDSVAAVRDLYNDWVVNDGSEGLVVRHQQLGWFKIKPRHNLDAAIIGFSEGSDDRKGLLHDLLVAVMRNDGSFHELCRVGGGFTDDDRKIIFERMRQRIVRSEYIAVNNDAVAYEMIEPGPVIEISCLDILSESSKGAPIKKTVLEWDHEKYSAVTRLPLVSVISPQYVRLRDDKEACVEDVNIRQLSNLYEIADTDMPALSKVLPASEMLERVVYKKVLKGLPMVRKLLLWKTNKSSDDFPGFVIYLTDFSPNRKNPLERDLRVASSEEIARDLFDRLAADNFVKGWERVS